MAELGGCGFPAAACADLDAAGAELERTRDDLGAMQDVVAWVTPAAERFREAAGAQWREAMLLAAACRDAADGLRRQGAILGTSVGATGTGCG